MDLTREGFVRCTLLSVTLIFGAAFVASALAYADAGSAFSLLQIGGLAAITAIQGAMLLAFKKGAKYAPNVAILSLNAFLPLFLVDEAFRYSLPQAIWVPFALALVVCSTRWAILTFATTLAVIFAFFPISEIHAPIGTFAITVVIFTVLTLGKVFQQNLTQRIDAARQAAKAAEGELRRSEARYRRVFLHAIDPISISRIDDGTYLEGNRAFFEILGYAPAEIIGQSAASLNLWESPARRQALLDQLRETGEVVDFEAAFRRKDGSLFWGLTSSSLIDIDGVPCRITVTRDITERKKADELIQFLAYYDQLTRLPNRTQLIDKLHACVATTIRRGHIGALLLIDLDDFRVLNDTRGHEWGDRFLKQVADQLTHTVSDRDTVARLGGDEFLVLLTDLGQDEHAAKQEAEATAQHIRTLLAREFVLGEEMHRSTASIGICLIQLPHTDSDLLMKRVELAMYRAKRTGKNQISLFDPTLEIAIAERAALEKDMRAGIADNHFRLYYQPQVVDTQRVGAEALVRWQHPERGMVSPADFIPLAEETGLILPLGLWVLREACDQLARWAHDPQHAHLTLAVNVSVRQFNQANFVEQVLTTLHDTGAQPGRLKLELTESLLAADVDSIIEKMHALKSAGIRFSLDDFGTGYSSLSYLKRLPIDQIKIDQAFVRDLLTNPDDISIAKTIIELGDNLGIDVIAEGVETAEHQQFLTQLGCHAYQGYLFGRPMPIAEFEGRVETPL